MLNELIQPEDSVVQIGAFDGVSFDPLWPVLRDMRLRTLRVEPHPTYFTQLALLHQKDAHVTCENVAIADRDGEVTLYYIEPFAGMPPWAAGVSTVMRGVNWLERFPGRIRSVQVRAARFRTLLERTAFPFPDVLVVDAEGYDLAIVEQALALGTPRIVTFEIVCLANGLARAKQLMEPHGYRLLASGDDVLWSL